MGGSCESHYATLANKTEERLYLSMSGIIITAAAVLNTTILYLIAKQPRLQKPSYLLFAALACTDMTMAVGSGSLYIVVTVTPLSSSCGLKTVCCCLTSFCAGSTILLLCIITDDRYELIRHSTSSRPHTTLRRVVVKISCCFGLTFSLSTLFALERVTKMPLTAVELLSLLVLCGFLFIIYKYVKLSKLIKLHDRKSVINAQADRPVTNNTALRNRNFILSVILLVSSFAIAYMPVTAIFLWQIVRHRTGRKPDDKLSYAFIWCSTFGYINSILDPLIYAFRSDIFGKELRKVYKNIRKALAPSTRDINQIERR